MKFSKKDFETKYKSEEVDELYDPKKGEIAGDTVITTNQIRTDTPVIPADSSSDRIKGVSKDTDKHIVQTRNQGADASKPYGMGRPYGSNITEEDKLKESAKEKMKKIVKELLQKRNDSSDLVKNQNYSDINRNDIPDLEELDDIHLSKLTNDILNSLQDKQEDVIAAVLNDLVIKLSTKLSPDYKNIIKRKL